MPIIYRKTPKGLTEIETRRHGLAPRARGALILVDGKRDHDTLASMVLTAGEALLGMLIEQGFIESVDKAGPAPTTGAAVSSPTTTPNTARPPAASPGAAPAVTSAAASDLVARRRAAVRDLNDLLGPVGESIAIRLERARDLAELAQLVQMAAQVINNARGRAAAQAFADRHRT